MTRAKQTLFAATAGLMVLGACTDTSVQTDNPRQRTTEGAAIGAGAGALAGILIGDDAKERKRGAVVGAVLGGLAGGVIGNNLDKQAAELNSQLGNDQIDVVNTGSELIVTMPQDILFDVDSAFVRAGLQSDLRVLAGSLNKYPDTTVDVIGHTDNTGSASHNQALSARRATAVTDVLANSGVSTARLRAIGRGEDAPVASNQTPEGRAQNRRVEIIIRPNA